MNAAAIATHQQLGCGHSETPNLPLHEKRLRIFRGPFPVVIRLAPRYTEANTATL